MSIKEIAKMAGTSVATVSRVLNNPDYNCKDEKLRQKIWQCAIDMSYTPNEAARNLKKGEKTTDGKTIHIGVIMTREDAAMTDSFFDELLRIVSSEIHQHNGILARVWYMPVLSHERKCKNENLDLIISQMYKENPCDGIMVLGKCYQNALSKFKHYFKNVVCLNRNPSESEVDEVVCDGYKVAETAVEYLISLGHTNIGYVGNCHGESRYRGYIDTLLKHHIDVDYEYIKNTNQTEQEGYNVMEKFLKEENYPTAFYCANDITAIGMLKCIEKNKRRYRVPSVIGSDDIAIAQNSKPMLTTVRLPKEEMGKFALYLLMDRVKGGHNNRVRLEMECNLMIRNSCYKNGYDEWSDYII